MNFEEFLKELKKVSEINLSLKDQDEWEDYFNERKRVVQDSEKEINQLDNKINEMVYNMYGLTDNEIAVVEKELNN